MNLYIILLIIINVHIRCLQRVHGFAFVLYDIIAYVIIYYNTHEIQCILYVIHCLYVLYMYYLFKVIVLYKYM